MDILIQNLIKAYEVSINDLEWMSDVTRQQALDKLHKFTPNWWTEEDTEKFNERKNALAAQYDGYEVVDGLTINSQFTSGENIGDLGGLSIAYLAYRMSLKGEEAPVIDGYTGDQRFFLGWAQVWRSSTRDEELKRRLTVDPHSPTKFRANGAAVNVPAFYTAFNVQEGDGMYLPPEERVKIW